MQRDERAYLARSRLSPQAYAQITHARRIVDFRNQRTHEYPAVDDAVVWLIAGGIVGMRQGGVRNGRARNPI
jgi:uncharacterized protein YutE (UPF0331/DUF86 family)